MPRRVEVSQGRFWWVWRVPVAMALLTLFGLLAALLGTGVWHWAAWLALAMPVAVSVWFGGRRSGPD